MTSEKFLPAKILDRRAVADDLFLLHVDPGGPFSYLAGQYATLGVEVEGERIERLLTAPPDRDRGQEDADLVAEVCL